MMGYGGRTFLGIQGVGKFWFGYFFRSLQELIGPSNKQRVDYKAHDH